MQNDPSSGVGSSLASKLRTSLELCGSIILAIALGLSLLVQVRVWKEVRNNGSEEEHDDFKVRTEEKRLVEMRRALEEQQTIIEKLKAAHEVVSKEKADGEAMRNHVRVATDNPIHAD